MDIYVWSCSQPFRDRVPLPKTNPPPHTHHSREGNLQKVPRQLTIASLRVCWYPNCQGPHWMAYQALTSDELTPLYDTLNLRGNYETNHYCYQEFATGSPTAHVAHSNLTHTPTHLLTTSCPINGQVLGPFPLPLLSHLRCSGVGVVPKKGHMIHHLSGSSINDFIPKDEFSLYISR